MKDFKEFTVNVNGTQSIEKHSLLAAVYLLKKLTQKKCLLNSRTAYISAGKFLIFTVILVAITLHLLSLLVELPEQQLEKMQNAILN